MKRWSDDVLAVGAISLSGCVSVALSAAALGFGSGTTALPREPVPIPAPALEPGWDLLDGLESPPALPAREAPLPPPASFAPIPELGTSAASALTFAVIPHVSAEAPAVVGFVPRIPPPDPGR